MMIAVVPASFTSAELLGNPGGDELVGDAELVEYLQVAACTSAARDSPVGPASASTTTCGTPAGPAGPLRSARWGPPQPRQRRWSQSVWSSRSSRRRSLTPCSPLVRGRVAGRGLVVVRRSLLGSPSGRSSGGPGEGEGDVLAGRRVPGRVTQAPVGALEASAAG